MLIENDTTHPISGPYNRLHHCSQAHREIEEQGKTHYQEMPGEVGCADQKVAVPM